MLPTTTDYNVILNHKHLWNRWNLPSYSQSGMPLNTTPGRASSVTRNT